MKYFQWPRKLGVFLLLSGLVGTAPFARGQGTSEEFEVKALATPTRGGSGFIRFTVTIDSYTPDTEVANLAELLRTDGSDAVLEALEDVDRENIRAVGTLAHEISFVRSRTTDNGRRLIVATARPITMFELLNLPRSGSYDFGVIQIDLDEDGNGDGAMAAAAQVRFNEDGHLEVEAYGMDPIRLTQVEQVH